MKHNLAIFALVIFTLFGCSSKEIKPDDMLYFDFCTADSDCQLMYSNHDHCVNAANKNDLDMAEEVYKKQFGCNFEPVNPVAKCRRNQCVVASDKTVDASKAN